MGFTTQEKFLSLAWFKAVGLIVSGALIMAIGYVYFIMPHQIVPGGVYGISIIISHLIGTPVGMTALVFNIPLTILGIKVLGPKFGWKTVLGFIMTSTSIDLLSAYADRPPLTGDDVLLSCIFGGALIGLGVGLIFRSKASVGGSDVIAMMLNKYTRIPISQLLLIIDSVIVLLGLAAFGDWRIPLYSWISIFILSKVVDTVLQGVSYDKTLFIISDKTDEIREKILNDLQRGGTILNGTGMYKGEPRKIIFTVVNRREVAILQDHIHSIDPNAFLSVIDANEIIGKGFSQAK
jgi:uncharacterized membrane-anchored protein YitT (DUF2179 family)